MPDPTYAARVAELPQHRRRLAAVARSGARPYAAVAAQLAELYAAAGRRITRDEAEQLLRVTGTTDTTGSTP